MLKVVNYFRAPEIPSIRVLAKTIRLTNKKLYRAQCIPFVLYIRVLKGICAQISESVRARVITFFCSGSVPVLNLSREAWPLAASQAGRYAGRMVCQCVGIRWMAHVEGKRMEIGWVLM